MAIAYTPPGIKVNELASAGINPVPSFPSTVCLVGLSRGYQLKTQQLKLGPGTAPVTLTVDPGGTIQVVDGSHVFVSAIDAVDPSKGLGTSQSGYVQGVSSDYTATVVGGNLSVTITPVAGSILDTSGGTVNFVYQFVDNNYFEPIRLDGMGAVETRFGPAYDPTGTSIQTTISYAASMAFENGVGTIVLQPLFKLTTPGNHASVKLQPATTGEAASVTNWTDTFYNLRAYDDINIIVPVVGQSAVGVGNSTEHSIHTALQDHQNFMLTQGQYVYSVIGEDSTTASTNGDQATLRANAADLASRYSGALAQSVVYVSPSKYFRALASNNVNSLAIGGQYIAASVAGMIASSPPTQPLTRRSVSGIAQVGELRTRADMDADAAAGLTVIQQKGLNVLVRHGITLDSSSVATREISVVRTKQNLIETLRATLDNALPIVSDGQAELVIASIVAGVLESLRQRAEIITFTNVDVRLLANDPTTAEVRFSYQPLFPVNNINIIFSLDLTGGNNVTATSTTSV